MSTILLIEDRDGLRQLYTEFLRGQGFGVVEAESVEKARQLLATREFGLILSDYMLPGVDGLTFLKELNQRDEGHVVIIMTAFGEVRLAVEAMRGGAFDFLEKPIDLEHLRLTVTRALQHRKSERRQEFEASRRDDGIVGESPALLASLDLIEKVAPTDTTCLLMGESGVGKELFASRVHDSSPRRAGPMVAVNCASIPGDLIESELFGHEKGAFTGAAARRIGLVEAAEGGTLFLDEIGELPLELQPKLLRMIQSKEYFRLGGNRLLRADIRLVCATNRDLKQGVREGWFREDLYFRLAVFPVKIAPLRQRDGDLDLLIPALLRKHGYTHGAPNDNLTQTLKRYSWPGNVRELENVLERAVILSMGKELQLEHFPKDILTEAPDQGDIGVGVDLDLGLKENLRRAQPVLEEMLIRRYLKQANDSRDRAASLMGVSVKTLYNKMKQFGIS